MKKSLLSTLVLCLLSFALTASAGFEIDRSAMSDRYWETWNDAEQAKIDADIEANRKADAEFSIDAPPGTEVTVELLDHEFRFGAHIFNYNQLGKTEYNDAYKASYGKGGIFNQATVAFYWDCYEPVPGRLRSGGDYEDTERFWNSISRDEAMEHPFWRRPAAAPVIDFLKAKDVSIHGHILIWGLARPFWLYDWYCPENEKRQLDALGIPRRTSEFIRENGDWSGGYGDLWRKLWGQAFARHGEAEIGALAPTYVKNLRRLFRKRVADVAKDFGDVVDSWDVVNESSVDWVKYRQSRTGLPIWKSVYGAMPGDYPLDALLDAGELMSPKAKLAINDWNIAPAFLDQVNDLEKNGARVSDAHLQHQRLQAVGAGCDECQLGRNAPDDSGAARHDGEDGAADSHFGNHHHLARTGRRRPDDSGDPDAQHLSQVVLAQVGDGHHLVEHGGRRRREGRAARVGPLHARHEEEARL